MNTSDDRIRELEGKIMRQRFELIDPSVNAKKFWEIEYPADGNPKAFRTYWGRIGSSPTSKVREWPTIERAMDEVEKIVASKKKEGYRGVDSSTAKSEKKAQPTRKGKALSSDEVNWLARNGWSSKQIKSMPVEEARRLIKAGAPKTPGKDTEAALSGAETGEESRRYRDALVAAGVGVRIPGGMGMDCYEALCRKIAEGSAADDRVAFAVRNAVFRDGTGLVFVLPPDEGFASSVVNRLLRVGKKRGAQDQASGLARVIAGRLIALRDKARA